MPRIGRPAAVLALLALGSCSPRGESADPPAAPPTVSVNAEAVEEHDFHDVVTASGRWRSSGDVAIVAPFDAFVDSLAVQVGDHVNAGQELCRLITREARAGLRGAEFLVAHATDEAGREDAALALELARHDLVRVPLSAPRAGTVVRLAAARGGEVAASAEILALVPDDAIVFEAHLSASHAASIRPGLAASVVEPGRPARTAVVRRVLPVVDAIDQSVGVWLSPTSSSPFPGIDRFGTATIETGGRRRVLAIPEAAVVEDDATGETRVASVEDSPSLAIWTTVTLGARAGGWREVLSSPLHVGSLVITEGQHGLPDSTRVDVAR